MTTVVLVAGRGGCSRGRALKLRGLEELLSFGFERGREEENARAGGDDCGMARAPPVRCGQAREARRGWMGGSRKSEAGWWVEEWKDPEVDLEGGGGGTRLLVFRVRLIW